MVAANSVVPVYAQIFVDPASKEEVHLAGRCVETMSRIGVEHTVIYDPNQQLELHVQLQCGHKTFPATYVGTRMIRQFLRHQEGCYANNTLLAVEL